MDVIKPIDPQFRVIPSEIRYDNRYMSFFKDCKGAIDGTHVDARIPVEDQVKYIGRHGITTQNVMAVSDFNMCFTFVLADGKDRLMTVASLHGLCRTIGCIFRILLMVNLL